MGKKKELKKDEEVVESTTEVDENVALDTNGDEASKSEKQKKKEKKKEKRKKDKEKLVKFEEKAKGKFNSFFADFKKFIAKGNIIDLAVAVVIGAAFNKIVTSLVNDIIMPLISLATGGASVADWKWVIKEATYDSAGNVLTAETALNYGVFIQTMIDFLIIALTIFIVLRLIVNSQRGVLGIKKKLKKLHKDNKQNVEVVESSAVEKVEKVEEPVAVQPTKIESEEDILKDIRELLKLQASQTIVNNSEVKIDENK